MRKNILLGTIVLIISFIVVILYKSTQPAGRVPLSKIQEDIGRLSIGIRMYKIDNGLYPTTEQGLLALTSCPTTGVIPSKWSNRGYIENKILPKDPWGNDYIYQCPGEYGEFDICSYGKDGETWRNR